MLKMFHNYIVQDNLLKINLVNQKGSDSMKKELKLIKMSSVEVEEIQWIWYPIGAQHFCGNARFAMLTVRLTGRTKFPRVPLPAYGVVWNK